VGALSPALPIWPAIALQRSKVRGEDYKAVRNKSGDSAPQRRVGFSYLTDPSSDSEARTHDPRLLHAMQSAIVGPNGIVGTFSDFQTEQGVADARWRKERVGEGATVQA